MTDQAQEQTDVRSIVRQAVVDFWSQQCAETSLGGGLQSALIDFIADRVAAWEQSHIPREPSAEEIFAIERAIAGVWHDWYPQGGSMPQSMREGMARAASEVKAR